MRLPAFPTPDDPYDVAGKQALVTALQADWWLASPEEQRRAVANGLRAALLSLRLPPKWAAVAYGRLQTISPEESDPEVFERAVRGDDRLWHVDEPQPWREPSFWRAIRKLAHLGPRIEAARKLAVRDVQQYGGSGFYFRARLLDLGIPGVGPRAASLAWFFLMPTRSQLGALDEDMPYADHLGRERELDDERRDEGFDVPLGIYEWARRDAERMPGFHQDYSALRVLDPSPWADDPNHYRVSKSEAAWRPAWRDSWFDATRETRR